MLLDELMSCLEAGGVGVAGQTLFLSALPEEPDTAAALYEYSGEAPLRVHNGMEHLDERPRVQVMARSNTYAPARLLVDRICRILETIRNISIKGTWYLSVEMLASPAFLGKDERNRTLIVANFQVTKEMSNA